MPTILDIAPNGNVSAYDRHHLLIYAELLDADASGINWMDGARSILGLNPAANGEAARLCWETHLARARWIVGEELQAAIDAFGKSDGTRDR